MELQMYMAHANKLNMQFKAAIMKHRLDQFVIKNDFQGKQVLLFHVNHLPADDQQMIHMKYLKPVLV